MRKGSKASEETKQKMRKAQQRLAKDPAIRKMRSENAKEVEARKRAEEATNPELAEQRSKIRSEAVKQGWKNRSRKISSETQKKLSDAGKKRYQNPEEREKISRQFKGVKKSPEHIAKIQAARKGWKPTEEQKEKMRKAQQELRASGWEPTLRKNRGNKKLKCLACKVKFLRNEIEQNGGFCDECITHLKECDCECGKLIFRYTREGHVRNYLNFSHRSNHIWDDEDARKWMSERVSGKNNPAWNNWASFEPYDERFNEEFKDTIRARQDYACAELNDTCKHKEGIALHVHHIDGNKLNSVPENCIALCNSHHARALWNSNVRLIYETYIIELMQKEAN